MSKDPTGAAPHPAGGEPRTLGGRYEVAELVGRGGMADVHLGHDLRLGRTVAIKILRTDLARDSSFLARFRREAQAAAGLSHPSIVGVYDSGEQVVQEAGGGADLHVPYIVMEFIDGRTLREVLNEHRSLEPDEAARITAAVLSALEYAHQRGLVHRDIKPANVMVTEAGGVKVMDFGIARALADTAATMTQTQAVMGTARYLSPEQAQGLDVDGRSDLYSVGCLFYELLTGRTPFQGDPVSLVYQHLGETPKVPSMHTQALPQAMDAITLHALEKRPEDRYQTAADFRADLHAARAEEPVSDAALLSHQRAIGIAGAAGAGAAVVARAQGGRATATQAVPAGGYVDGRVRRPAGDDEDYGSLTSIGLSPVGRTDERAAAAGGAAGGAADGAAAAGYGAAGRGGGPEARGPDDDERYERTDELPVREQRHRGAALLLGALALLALAGVAWVLFQVLGPGADDGPETVLVPSTVGQSEAAARTTLTGLGLQVPEAQQRNSSEPIGTVIEQRPEGAEAEVGSQVQLVVSSGPSSIAIPRVTGLEEQAARDMLEREGFRNVREEVEESDDPRWEEGQVISTDPGEGDEVAPDEEIVLTVSSGMVAVPDVVGQNQNVAVRELSDQSLEWEITLQRTGEAEAGTVLSQSVEEGDRVEQGMTIDLVVALEPIQTETATVRETIFITPTPDPTTPDPPEPTSPEPTSPEPTSPEPTSPDPTGPDPTDPVPTVPPTDPDPTER